ncbi:MAG: DMT family transporter [Rubripirellula sp.]
MNRTESLARVQRFLVLSDVTRRKAFELVQGFGFVLVAVVIGLFAGCLLGTQPSVNGQLGKHLEHPLQASLISFSSGTAIILLLSFASGVFPPAFTSAPSGLPWWIWFGGAIGVILVTSSLILVPKVGSLPWFAAVMTGQTIAALLLDHFGLLGNPRTEASPLRLLGAGLLIAGVLVIVHAKRVEHLQMLSESPVVSEPESSGPSDS